MPDRKDHMSRVGRTIGSLLAAALWVPPAASPQDAPGPPPPSSTRSSAGPEVHELLPDLGRIGSEVGILAGPSWNPYEVGGGYHVGGFIDLPLLRVPGGTLSYEILIAFSDAKSDPFMTTNSVAFVANLAAGASPADALAGPPAAPFPVRRQVTTRLHLLEVAPFALRYEIHTLDHLRLRPYFGLGLDFLVTITRQDPVQGREPDLHGDGALRRRAHRRPHRPGPGAHGPQGADRPGQHGDRGPRDGWLGDPRLARALLEPRIPSDPDRILERSSARLEHRGGPPLVSDR